MQHIFTVGDDGGGQRIDKLIADKLPDLSRTSAANICENGGVFVNEKAVGKKYKVSSGDEIRVEVPEPVELKAEAEDIPLDIVYEDQDLLVVNKPKGMVVHPAP